jgi:uncharacterized membrane protein YeaQ/YmgE (transglycosylase-associated protein family)
MEFVWMIVIGLVVGAIAKFLMPGYDPGGIIVTILLGIAGALSAGWFGQAVGLYSPGNVGVTLVASVVGAMLLLLLYRVVIGRRHPTHHTP